MIIAYYSRTGNVRDFLEWYLPEYERRNIEEWDADEAFILVTPTYNFGEVPEEVLEWLETDSDISVDTNGYFGVMKPTNWFMEGVIGSGNRNFGSEWFCNGAKSVAERYDVPLLHTFELKGSQQEADIVRGMLNEL